MLDFAALTGAIYLLFTRVLFPIARAFLLLFVAVVYLLPIALLHLLAERSRALRAPAPEPTKPRGYRLEDHPLDVNDTSRHTI